VVSFTIQQLYARGVALQYPFYGGVPDFLSQEFYFTGYMIHTTKFQYLLNGATVVLYFFYRCSDCTHISYRKTDVVMVVVVVVVVVVAAVFHIFSNM
jgi:hypothetical protein